MINLRTAQLNRQLGQQLDRKHQEAHMYDERTPVLDVISPQAGLQPAANEKKLHSKKH